MTSVIKDGDQAEFIVKGGTLRVRHDRDGTIRVYGISTGVHPDQLKIIPEVSNVVLIGFNEAKP